MIKLNKSWGNYFARDYRLHIKIPIICSSSIPPHRKGRSYKVVLWRPVVLFIHILLHYPRFFPVFRSLLMSPAPQTDIQSWRMTTIYSVRAGSVRDGGCHSYSWSCCCKFKTYCTCCYSNCTLDLSLKGCDFRNLANVFIQCTIVLPMVL